MRRFVYAIFAVASVLPTSSCMYRALKAKCISTQVVSISCIDLDETCEPKDLRFEAVRFEVTTSEDIGESFEGYLLQAHCELDGNWAFAFGPYHAGKDLGGYPSAPGSKSADGTYHYVIYALPHGDGLAKIAQSHFRELRCAIRGVQKAPVPLPRTNYFAMTKAEFLASYELFVAQNTRGE